ncbi:hypothetical protein HZA99_00350 [Candidatus Woesearchaeota archaeon]|nr:hypothetical protein [Candidatus Woesearchaeota archaeon]
MEAMTKTRKIGGSLIVTIPQLIVKHESLRENQIITIEVKKIKKSGFGISRGLSPFSKEDKFRGQLEDNG